MANEKKPVCDDIFKYPNLRVNHLRHSLSIASDKKIAEGLKKSLLELVIKDEMLPYYINLCTQFNWTPDESTVKCLEEKNQKVLNNMTEKISYAEEQFGYEEVKDAIQAKANYYCKVGDKDNALTEYNKLFDKTTGIGSKMDVLLVIIRLGFFTNDIQLVKKTIARAKEQLEKGGDWERRNKLKVYEALQMMVCKNFKGALANFLEAIPTFTATELISYDNLVFYTVLLSIIILDRADLRKKVLENPDMIKVIPPGSFLYKFASSLYSCKYNDFMTCLVNVSEMIKNDIYFSNFRKYYIRQARIPAYSQYLAPFKTVELENMCNEFGFSKEFIEEDLVSYICSGKLFCKIDRVNGIIESNHPNSKNLLYANTIKQGDILLNRIHKLSRLVDI
ncbi:26S proteasome regulatory subunit N7 [Babesia microti strain RI]|uniref:26S proteasome regulatory subunit N7 n=1 Tax=Babesia microti (strain RI) TaxID=1133968 RepID=I7IFT0_BABMR|nr:26S proteasome regulatory subunit N7 [Babesia microti strain RI]CCF73046.1 26S proteasome regulatory subunit N7 [Babesia microti strain RI]|eukprot:XP_012647655.1 26S proteasome regulatory subunit N7 [Babesia microti strain RI]